MKNIKMLVVTHKPYNFPKSNLYFPIQVNAEKNSDLGYLKDNQGDNISLKNQNFCELTALYWAWKNLDCEYIGINHYRRYLSTHSKNEIRKAKTEKEKFDLILTEEEILDNMKEYDVLVPKTKLYTKNVYSKYAQQHHIKDMDNCRKIIEKKYPEYLESFDKVMKQKEYAICNMCVMSKENFDNYSKWLFDILFELEENTDLSDYSPLQKRIYGFLSERLFNVWLDKNNMNVKTLNMVAMEHDSFKVIVKKSFKRVLHQKS